MYHPSVLQIDVKKQDQSDISFKHQNPTGGGVSGVEPVGTLLSIVNGEAGSAA